MKSNELDWKSGRLVFWDLDLLDTKKSLADQLDELKEDLVQVDYPGGLLLDAGWYPEFCESGLFVVKVVRDFNWENLLFEVNANTIDGFVRSLNEAIDFIERVELESGRQEST